MERMLWRKQTEDVAALTLPWVHVFTVEISGNELSWTCSVWFSLEPHLYLKQDTFVIDTVSFTFFSFSTQTSLAEKLTPYTCFTYLFFCKTQISLKCEKREMNLHASHHFRFVKFWQRAWKNPFSQYHIKSNKVKCILWWSSAFRMCIQSSCCFSFFPIAPKPEKHDQNIKKT